MENLSWLRDCNRGWTWEKQSYVQDTHTEYENCPFQNYVCKNDWEHLGAIPFLSVETAVLAVDMGKHGSNVNLLGKNQMA
jgi:hypothetical protein